MHSNACQGPKLKKNFSNLLDRCCGVVVKLSYQKIGGVREMKFHAVSGHVAKTMQRVAVTLVVPVLCMSLCGYMGAQTNTGRILGAVTDPSGATVAGATVIVTE